MMLFCPSRRSVCRPSALNAENPAPLNPTFGLVSDVQNSSERMIAEVMVDAVMRPEFWTATTCPAGRGRLSHAPEAMVHVATGVRSASDATWVHHAPSG